VAGEEMSLAAWSQIAIVHLSDLHFGKPHRFQPKITPGGDRPKDEGFPELRASLLADATARLAELYQSPESLEADSIRFTGLNGIGPMAVRTIFALTGDLTESAEQAEFRKAESLVDAIRAAPGFVPNLSADDIFVVPGNHDLVYDAEEVFDRWSHYCHFYKKLADQRALAPQPINADDPQGLSRIIDQSKNGLVIAEINSAAYVRKDSPEALRGHIDITSLARIKKELDAIDHDAMQNSVRIAMIHHHPVVLPTLAEPNRGYDAVINAGPLLGLLKRHGFHLILHGHKHDAQTFPHDSVSAWSGTGSQPMMVVSGGSAGSTELPANSAARNTYNIIVVKWHPASRQARIRIETRGLAILDEKYDELLPQEWAWKELRVDDRLLKAGGDELKSTATYRRKNASDDSFESKRDKHLIVSRRCWPVVEVVPSLHSDQAFEARVWIDGQPDKKGYQAPERVEWNAGRYFPEIAVCNGAGDPTFSARFSYYGPTAIQARLFWPDGHQAIQYIFAHFPGAGPSITGPSA
jgi:3',5'-cyclic AMP phosphodiesterase CpdA